MNFLIPSKVCTERKSSSNGALSYHSSHPAVMRKLEKVSRASAKLTRRDDGIDALHEEAPSAGLNQQAAAKRMGIPQPKVSGMMRGDFTNLVRELMDCLNRLGYDIEIKVRQAAEPTGRLTLATA